MFVPRVGRQKHSLETRKSASNQPGIAVTDHVGLAGTSGLTLQWMSWKPQYSGVTIFLAPGDRHF